MAIVTRGISSSKSGKEAGSTPNAEITHPHKSVLEPKKILARSEGAVRQPHRDDSLLLTVFVRTVKYFLRPERKVEWKMRKKTA